MNSYLQQELDVLSTTNGELKQRSQQLSKTMDRLQQEEVSLSIFLFNVVMQ